MTDPSSRRALIYLGWQGFMNFGDDLLYDTWRAALGDRFAACAPLGRDYLRRSPQVFGTRMRAAGSERLVLLGGGTTVGFANWGRHARRAVSAYGAHGLIVAGAGIAAATDERALSTQDQDWDVWSSLKRVAYFGVRGPISSAESAEHWRDAPIVGDPALLYPLVRTVVAPSGPPSIGVSIGAGGRSAFDLAAVASAVDASRERLGAERVLIFQLAEEDEAVCAQLRSLLSSRCKTVVYRGDVHETMSAIAGTGLFFSERLHGVVAAVALGVPTVPLAYASKSVDFWRSVTDRPLVGRAADAHAITAAADAALDPAEQASVASRVSTLCAHLVRAAGLVGAWQDGTVSTAALFGAANAR
ncbi:polysaccharide pyruvyl transferase family protein [Leifsonia sp. Le1]|uniref:polysaccharide pyruvyl transferase family protein n=1 Tax=Leifsonia sp. Le1 TaxID=3404918 RepID=UPI003EC132FA